MKSGLHWIACLLVVAGAINWGLVGLFEINLVKIIFCGWPLVQRLVYITIGAAGVLLPVLEWQGRKSC